VTWGTFVSTNSLDLVKAEVHLKLHLPSSLFLLLHVSLGRWRPPLNFPYIQESEYKHGLDTLVVGMVVVWS